MGYEILEHTADAKFRATGYSLEEAFTDAVEAFSEIVGDGETGTTKHEIDVESESLEALLFDFMDRLIYLQDVNDVVIGRAENVKVEDSEKGHRLTSDIYVDNLSAGCSYLDIKGPTYNEMKIEHGDQEWVLEVVLDI